MHLLTLLTRSTDRTLLVDWRPDHGCNASFLDLFQAPSPAVFRLFDHGYKGTSPTLRTGHSFSSSTSV